jgi:ribosome silencing factor RsfS/YbeB/iojap
MSEPRDRPRKTGTTPRKAAPVARKTAKSATAKKAAAVKKTAKKSATPARKSAIRKPASRHSELGIGDSGKKPLHVRGKSKSGDSGFGIRDSAERSPRARGKSKPVDPLEQLRTVVLNALDDLKAKDVRQIDVRGKSGFTDLLVVASGTSSRHVQSIADEVVKKAKQAGVPPIGVEGQREAEWVLVDLGDVIVHVMLPRTREFYALERLWTVGDTEPQAASF